MPSQEELDRLYGVLTQPRYVDTLEESTPPLSRFQLRVPDQHLREFLNMALAQSPVDYLLYQSVYFLWLVNDRGDVLLAYEEFFPNNDDYRAPRQRDCPVPSGRNRLGHPALVGGGAGRIGGELQFDDRYRSWVLSNRSGRYGYDPDRREQHLRNVAKRFEESGIPIQVKFCSRGEVG